VPVQPFRRLTAAYRRADPFKVDVVIAAVFVAAVVLEASVEKTGGGSRAATAIAGGATLAVMAWRRRAPLPAAVAFGALSAAQPLVDSFFFGPQTNAPVIASLLMAFSAGRHLEGRDLRVAGTVLLAGFIVGIASSPNFEGLVDLLWAGILFFPPLIAAHAIRNRVALRQELREKAERLEAERETAARRAVEEERDRIASELQAVVANGVSAMVVQAEAVPRLLDAGDPARAGYAFRVIEETGRDSLAEMRRLLGVLRREGQRAELAPQPGLARLGALIERARDEGLAVELRTTGDPRPLAQGIDLTAYRVAQEGLRRAAASGASEAAVELHYGERDLEIEVRDDRDGGPEDSLSELRQRLSLYGGHVTSSRPESGGYRLEARLPARGASEAPPAPVGGSAP
jgi:signal transduction histidine kinase